MEESRWKIVHRSPPRPRHYRCPRPQWFVPRLVPLDSCQCPTQIHIATFSNTVPAVKSLSLWEKMPKASSHLCPLLNKHSTFPLFPETASFVSDYIKAHPDLESDPTHIIEGWGWDHASWDVEKMPTWVRHYAFP